MRTTRKEGSEGVAIISYANTAWLTIHRDVVVVRTAASSVRLQAADGRQANECGGKVEAKIRCGIGRGRGRVL